MHVYPWSYGKGVANILIVLAATSTSRSPLLEAGVLLVLHNFTSTCPVSSFSQCTILCWPIHGSPKGARSALEEAFVSARDTAWLRFHEALCSLTSWFHVHQVRSWSYWGRLELRPGILILFLPLLCCAYLDRGLFLELIRYGW
jgi:hypothetical protein